MFVAGSLWGLFGCGVAYLGGASDFRRLSDSRYALILDCIEAIKEIIFGTGPDDRMERGSLMTGRRGRKHSILLQSSRVFESFVYKHVKY